MTPRDARLPENLMTDVGVAEIAEALTVNTTLTNLYLFSEFGEIVAHRARDCVMPGNAITAECKSAFAITLRRNATARSIALGGKGRAMH